MKPLIIVFLCVCVFYTLAAAIELRKSITLHCSANNGFNGNLKTRLRARAGASDKRTIWLHEGEELSIDFTLPHESFVDVKDVRYSNDGGHDRIKITLDGEMLGEFWTDMEYGWGTIWNEFESSGKIGETVLVNPGRHTLSLRIDKADEYGVEIDYIRFEVYGTVERELKQGNFACKYHQ
ncbi:hypothetical protein ACJMK2_034895 [Sinanodonta woodiana]|uniref:Uncharacterized protein n=1 Tax=Sinanodonta woodiana TaxID=1069815 RepID=A0ABD3WT36_SINWO